MNDEIFLTRLRPILVVAAARRKPQSASSHCKGGVRLVSPGSSKEDHRGIYPKDIIYAPKCALHLLKSSSFRQKS